jgi:hypothetical protein
MSRSHYQIACSVLALVIAGVSSGVGQRLPFEEASTIRFALATGDTAWSYGQVLTATRFEVLIEQEGSVTPLMVPFHNQLNLQVRRGRKSNFLLGGAIGLAAGVALGTTALTGVFGEEFLNPGQARLQSGIVFGAGGALAGALIARQFGSENWVDVDLSEGYIPAAPRLADNAGTYSVRRSTNRWQRFEPTERDFRAFFSAHDSTLQPIEGIWERGVNGRRVAILQDRGFNGFPFIIVRITRYRDRATSRSDGLIEFALRFTGEGGWYEVADPGGSRSTRDRAELTGDLLTIRRGARVRGRYYRVRTVGDNPAPIR